MKFTAKALGYEYEWETVSDILTDVFGKPFIMCRPVRRLSGKQGRLTRKMVWHLSVLPRPVQAALKLEQQ